MHKYLINDYINEYLEKNNIQNYDRNDILRIIAFILNKDKNYIYINLDKLTVNDDELSYLKTKLDELYIKNIPLQYILGKQSFYNEEYIVNENVLVPRADTEILVEKAISYISEFNLKSMMDLCCGSGCIGISILNNSNIDNCTFVDISDKALDVTKKNIVHNKVSKDTIVINSNLFTDISDKFDIIVSNPPYIPTKDIKSLDKNVQNEPILALDGGIDGLDKYKQIINEASKYLNDGGFLILEIGYDQLEYIIKIIENSKLKFIESVKDYGNNDRVVVCRFHQK